MIKESLKAFSEKIFLCKDPLLFSCIVGTEMVVPRVLYQR